MPSTMRVVGGLGTATDEDVTEGVTYTSDNGIKRTGRAASILVDETLTQYGAAADAGVVGNEISKLRETIDEHLTNHPSGTSSEFKLLASVPPITEGVRKIIVEIQDDGIHEIYIYGKCKETENVNYSYACICINERSASYNTAITPNEERFVIYHGVILQGGKCLFSLKIAKDPRDTPTILSTPQLGFSGYGECIKKVSLEHPGGGTLAVGTYFEVWGR